MSRKFQRCIESFVCINCGAETAGDGYTNHCPRCLWSLHVDVNPGDREETCRGPMEPVGAETADRGITLIHRCTRCGHVRKNRTASADDLNRVLPLLQPAARGGRSDSVRKRR